MDRGIVLDLERTLGLNATTGVSAVVGPCLPNDRERPMRISGVRLKPDEDDKRTVMTNAKQSVAVSLSAV
jgi:hypothetical protein